MALGPVTVGNGVVFVASMDLNPAEADDVFALDALTGNVCGPICGELGCRAPAVAGNSIYWGSRIQPLWPVVGHRQQQECSLFRSTRVEGDLA